MNENISLWFLEEGNKQRVEDVLHCCEDDAAEVIMNLREDLLCALKDLKKVQDELDEEYSQYSTDI
ncbi:hypothetical protein VP14_224 [Vibrio phage VPMCC14]|nr:hypothetical protein VP14_224 [Vibrio phage VPMCC14]